MGDDDADSGDDDHDTHDDDDDDDDEKIPTSTTAFPLIEPDLGSTII